MTPDFAERTMHAYVDAMGKFEAVLDTNPQVDRDGARARAKLLAETTPSSFSEAFAQVASEILDGANYKKVPPGPKVEIVLGNGPGA